MVLILSTVQQWVVAENYNTKQIDAQRFIRVQQISYNTELDPGYYIPYLKGIDYL